MKINLKLTGKHKYFSYSTTEKYVLIRYWGGLKFDRCILYAHDKYERHVVSKEQFRSEYPISINEAYRAINN